MLYSGRVMINIRLFAQNSGEKTEKATPKKRREARRKGQILQSRELSSSIILLLAFLCIKLFAPFIFRQLDFYTKDLLTNKYLEIDSLFTINMMVKFFIEIVLLIIRCVLPLFAVVMLAGLLTGYMQVGFIFTAETMGFKFSRINPLSGLKRIISFKGLVELVKSLVKIAAAGYIAYSYLTGEAENVAGIMQMEPSGIITYIGNASVNAAVRICAALVVISVLDYLYQWREHEKNLKMTKQEVKEEFKQTEGNPEIKSKLKHKQRQMSMSRMLHDVPKADVVVTNPTHYAIAIKYDTDVSDAPVVLAKGKDYLAQRIRDTARENKVEIVENVSLAHTLYETVDIGEVIPPELYQAVAEVLAFVYNLRNKNGKI